MHVLGARIYSVTTRDVLSFALGDVRFFSSQVHECVCFGRHSVNCVSLCDPVGIQQLLLSTACAVRELSGTSGACCFFPCCQFILVTRLSS